MNKEKLKNRFVIYARHLFIVVFVPCAVLALFLSAVLIAQTIITWLQIL